MSLRKSSYHLALSLAASATLALPAQASLDDQAPTTRVANATKAAECDFPPVVYVSGCTGTLVHPRVVVYAWHCGKPKSVKFTESGRSGGGFSVPATCKTYSGGTTNAKDWAYCLLSEPVTDVPIVPVVAGCEYEMISKAGQEVVQVGFGKTHSIGAGTKHWGVSEVTSVEGGVVTVGDKNSVVACPGDSGGPLMVRMEDKSWRTIGILSTYNGRCGAGGVNWYADAYTALSWIEKDSGIDITPCFDDQGEWEPGPDCGGFYAGNPGEPSGNWGNKCEGTARSGRSSTCGPAGDSGGAESSSGGDEGGGDEGGDGDDGGGDDATGPETTIVSPKDGDKFDADESIRVMVKASGDANISEIELFVDGESQGAKKKAPFRWTIKGLSSGEVELSAVAKDEDGNTGKSDVTTIVIGDGEDGEDSDGSGDDGDSDSDGSDNDSDGSDNSEDSENGSANASSNEEDKKKDGCAIDANQGAGLMGLALGFGLLTLRRRRS